MNCVFTPSPTRSNARTRSPPWQWRRTGSCGAWKKIEFLMPVKCTWMLPAAAAPESGPVILTVLDAVEGVCGYSIRHQNAEGAIIEPVPELRKGDVGGGGPRRGGNAAETAAAVCNSGSHSSASTS